MFSHGRTLAKFTVISHQMQKYKRSGKIWTTKLNWQPTSVQFEKGSWDSSEVTYKSGHVNVTKNWETIPKLLLSPLPLQGYKRTFWLALPQKALMPLPTEIQRKSPHNYSTFDVQGISYYKWSTSHFSPTCTEQNWLPTLTLENNWPSLKEWSSQGQKSKFF